MPNAERPDMDWEVSRFWNELVQPGLQPDRDALPADQAETLLRLYGMTQAPLPEMARTAATRAIPPFPIEIDIDTEEPGLRPGNGHAPTDWRRTTVIARASALGDAIPATPPAAPAAPMPPATARRRVWASMQLAMSLLLVTAVGLVYFALGPARFRPEPSAGASLETVFAATLPDEMIPDAGNLDFLVWRWRVETGTDLSFQWPIAGIQIQHVLQGDLALSAEKSLQVYRGSGATPSIASGAEVPPGTPIVLHPGDTAVYEFDQQMTYTNLTSTPVELVGGGLFSGYGGWLPQEFTLIDHNEQYPVDELAPGPVQASLVRAVLPPDGEVPAPPAGSLTFDVGAIKESDIAKRMDGSLRNIGPEDAAIYVLTLTPLADEDTPQAGPADS